VEVDKVRIATISDALCYGTKFFDAQAYFDLPLRLRDEERLKQTRMELDELEEYHIRHGCQGDLMPERSERMNEINIPMSVGEDRTAIRSQVEMETYRRLVWMAMYLMMHCRYPDEGMLRLLVPVQLVSTTCRPTVHIIPQLLVQKFMSSPHN
jgi:hypothetical protein